jgi:hypothetical protein
VQIFSAVRINDGEESGVTPAMSVDREIFTAEATLAPGAGRHWLRIEVRDRAGTLQLTSSPLYINFPD